MTSVAGGTTTTTAVSACFRPRPRPITLNVPVRLEEKVPLAVMLPPVELHTVPVDATGLATEASVHGHGTEPPD